MSFTAPKTYKAMAVKARGGRFELVDMPWKEPQAGQVVVKVLACGVCHTDRRVAETLPEELFPRVPGHEIVGEVVAVHATEKEWSIGQRVGGGWHGGHCHACPSCRKGDYMMCRNEDNNGITMDGGYAEYATLRSEAVVSVPDDLDPAEAAPLLCAGVTTFNALRGSDVFAGDLVAIQGIGGLGHLAIQYCRKMGFRTVALSSSSAKESLSTELGAHYYIDSSKEDQAAALQRLGGARVILATAPSPSIMRNLVLGLAPRGQIVLLALFDELPLSVIPVVDNGLTIRGSPAGTASDCEDAIKFADLAGVKCLIERYPLEKANEAFTSMITGEARFRAVLVPN
ncbi:hypothetical protein PLICRDRAFT_49750 [Plicaturopsis crispa FD-325 SS-3]|nr:hypothetical protein PLICRDRAFT_49750 [Plicaturopsis crispa FD-325 SS-3]